MKKLYYAELSCKVAFMAEEDKAEGVANNISVSELKDSTVEVGFVEKINSRYDIPVDMIYDVPLYSEGEMTCDSYFDCRDEAHNICQKLREKGYTIESKLEEDIRKLLVEYV